MSPQQKLESLCESILDESASSADLDALKSLLIENPELKVAFCNQLVAAESLRQFYAPEKGQADFAKTTFEHVTRLAREKENAFPQKVVATIRQRKAARILAIAAVLALCALPLLLLRSPSSSDLAREPILVRSIVIADVTGEQIPGYVQSGQKVAFNSGLLRLEFDNGAVVALESPASFLIHDKMSMRLFSGTLNAWCPETAHGFQVLTGDTTLTDLGTSFGVSSSLDGSTDFVVLQGSVEVERNHKKHLLKTGNAIRSNSTGGLSVTDFETTAFRRTWPVASGILSTSGQVIPAPPATPYDLARYEDNENVIVIPERTEVQLDSPLLVDLSEPGKYVGLALQSRNKKLNPSHEKLRSYLIRYNPVGIRTLDEFEKFVGSVTFDHPVRAIITGKNHLNSSDAIFSDSPLPETSEPRSMRGLEQQPPNPSDEVTLSEDRRTVKVTFFAGESIDEIRVLTNSAPD